MSPHPSISESLWNTVLPKAQAAILAVIASLEGSWAWRRPAASGAATSWNTWPPASRPSRPVSGCLHSCRNSNHRSTLPDAGLNAHPWPLGGAGEDTRADRAAGARADPPV